MLEAEIAGFGASGRNGGWCSALFPASLDALARLGRPGGALALHRAMRDTVDEVGRVAAAEGIDAHFAKGGTITLARNRAQLARARAEVADARRWGSREDDLRLLDADEARARARGDRGPGALVHPATARRSTRPRLVRGLADGGRAPRRRGSTSTPAVRPIEPGRRRAPTRGTVRAGRRGPRDRGLHRRAAGQRARGGAGLLADDRHRAAAGGRSGTQIGLAPAGDVHRPPAPDHLRPAHRRRPAGVRRPRRAVPLRLADPARRSTASRGSSPRCARPWSTCSRCSRDARITHAWGGALGIAARLVRLGRAGPRHRARLGRRLRRRRRRHHQPRRPHAARPGPRPRHRPDPAAVGRPPLAGAGSPSRCAGWASTPGCAR